MALLEILYYPDKRLRTKAKKVSEITATHQSLIDDMLETMYQAPGIGLAATQVNVHEQILVIDISEQKDSPLILINPKIIDQQGEDSVEEGCLSVPETYANVDRAKWIRFSALDRDGKLFEMETDELLAICVQHEIDHLKGKLFVDYLSKLKQNRIRKKIEKIKNQKL